MTCLDRIESIAHMTCLDRIRSITPMTRIPCERMMREVRTNLRKGDGMGNDFRIYEI